MGGASGAAPAGEIDISYGPSGKKNNIASGMHMLTMLKV